MKANKKRILVWILVLVVILAICILIYALTREQGVPDGTAPSSTAASGEGVQTEPLQLISIEMSDEYGDATLIKLGDYEILVDAGDVADGKNVQAVLTEYCQDKVLEMLVVTHVHADHIGGFTTNFFSFAGIEQVGTIVDFGNSYSSQAYIRYAALRQSLVTQGSSYFAIADLVSDDSIPDVYYLDDGQTYIEFLDTGHYAEPGKKASGDLNDSSVVFCLNYNDTQVLMTGDFTSKYERDLVANIKSIDPNYFPEENRVIYKASHHGSNGSNGDTLLDFAKPDAVFISSAITKGNRASSGIVKAQHPYSGAVTRMAKHTDQIYWNGINGTLIFTITQEGMEVLGLGRSFDYYVDGQKIDARAEKDIPYLESAWYQAA